MSASAMQGGHNEEGCFPTFNVTYCSSVPDVTFFLPTRRVPDMQ